MRFFPAVSVLATLVSLQAAAALSQDPLPPLAALRARALTTYKQSEAARERYICRERIEDQELDGSGRVKKNQTTERELFFVNGFQISQEVAQDGHPLSSSALRKRDQAVQKAIASASDHRPPRLEGLVINASDILRMARLQGERRIQVAGRPTLVFDIIPDAKAKASTIEEKLVAAMQGTLSIDEASGNLQDVNTQGTRDVKVAGGLVANVHKAFALHILLAPQPDGVWLLQLAEGTGDARIGLFVHAGMRFHQQTEGCKLFDVSTTQATAPPNPTPR